MHHERVVQAFMRAVTILTFDMAVFFVDLRGLREAGLLFVDRLGYEDTRIIRTEFQEHRTAVAHHRNELFVTYPSGVKENVVAEVTDLFNDLFRVVDRAVVSTELDNRQTERTFFFRFFRIHFGSEFAEFLLIEAAFQDTADETERVTRGFQVYRSCAGLNQSAVVDRFVVVAVIENQVAGGEQSVQYDFIGGGRTVQNEVRFVRIVDLRCVLLRIQSRTFMNQEVAQLNVGVAKVGAEYVFAKEIKESTACGHFTVEHTTLMARAVKLRFAGCHIVSQRTEERR